MFKFLILFCKYWTIYSVLCCLILYSSCGSVSENGSDVESPQPGMHSSVEEFKVSAEQAVMDAQQVLLTQLAQAIGTMGLEAAVSFCHEHALELTDSVADFHGLAIRRISDRYRNPVDAADVWELDLLDHYKKSKLDGLPLQDTVIQHAETGTDVFYRPIILGADLCLKCHGTPGVELQAVTAEAIRKFYPNDLAVGYALGDVRGIWRISKR